MKEIKLSYYVKLYFTPISTISLTLFLDALLYIFSKKNLESRIIVVKKILRFELEDRQTCKKYIFDFNFGKTYEKILNLSLMKFNKFN